MAAFALSAAALPASRAAAASPRAARLRAAPALGARAGGRAARPRAAARAPLAVRAVIYQPGESDTSQGSAPQGASRVQTSGEAMIKIVSEMKSTAPVRASGAEGLDLASYLRVSPEFVAELDLPLGAQLRRTSLSEWVIELPKMDLFDVWVQPTATATAESRLGEFHIWSDKAEIEGSQHVQSLELYKRYDCLADIRWLALDADTLMCVGKLTLNIDMPPPFSLMPRVVTQTASDFAVNTMMRVLTDAFTKKLAEDYNRWSADAGLRAAREAKYMHQY